MTRLAEILSCHCDEAGLTVVISSTVGIPAASVTGAASAQQAAY
jgi:hypothetical protein